jgi:hypothetical protein
MAEVKRLTLKKSDKPASKLGIWLNLSTRYALRALWGKGISKLLLVLPAIPLLSALANIGFHIVFPMMARRQPSLVDPNAVIDSAAFPIFLYTVLGWSKVFAEIIHSDYLIMAKYRRGGYIVPLAVASGPMLTNIVPMLLALTIMVLAQISVSTTPASLYIDTLQALTKWILANTLSIALVTLMLSITRSYQLAITLTILVIPLWSIGLEIIRTQTSIYSEVLSNLSLAKYLFNPSSSDIWWMTLVNLMVWLPAYISLRWRMRKGGK